LKEGKKKLKFNILDLLVIFAVIAALILGFVYFRFIRTERDDVWVYYTVEVEGRLKGFHEVIKHGDEIRDVLRNYDMGTVVSYRVRESMDWRLNNETEQFEQQFFDEEEIVEVKIRARAIETEDVVFLSSGGGDIRVGMRMILEGKGYSLQGFIIEYYTEERGGN